MTRTSPTDDSSSTHHITDPSTTSTTTTATEHYSRSANARPELRTTATRSNDYPTCQITERLGRWRCVLGQLV